MAKEIRECRESKLDLSDRKLGDEGVAELVPELKVIPFEVLLATAWMFLLHTHLPTYLPPTYLPTYLQGRSQVVFVVVVLVARPIVTITFFEQNSSRLR